MIGADPKSRQIIAMPYFHAIGLYQQNIGQSFSKFYQMTVKLKKFKYQTDHPIHK